MTKTAFVAHSFTQEDSVHVTALLEFLSGISKVNPHFNWKHARDAEPRDVRDKVIDISAGVDFFIAICSRKERIFDPKKARKALLSRSKLVLEDSDCDWATSSWIIQEIGLALGRHLPVILLVEKGVRSPGGMQGNLEYIEFDRAIPGECFVRLSEMLGSLIADKAPSDQEARTEAKAPEGSDQVRPNAAEQRSEPSDEMSLSELREGLLSAYLERDVSLSDRYDATFRASQFGASEEARAEWDARKSWLSQIIVGTSDVNAVAALSRKFPTNPEIGTNYARLLNILGESDAAATEFERVSDLGGKDAKRVERLCDSARVLAQSGNLNSAMSVLRTAISSLSDNEDVKVKTELASVLGDVLEQQDKFLKAALSEHVMQLKPGDFDARSQLAYLYGDMSMPAQAMHNYLRIPEEVRSPWAWNNLGVEFGNVSAKGKAVNAYVRAEREGNELAISNRARLLRDGGFLDEAEQTVRAAMRAGAEEPALAETLTSVVSQREEDDKIVKARRAEARKIEAIAKTFGSALLTPAGFDWNGEWVSDELTITIRVIANRIEGSGSYERDRGLSRLLSGLVASSESSKETVLVRVSAEVVGSGAFGSIERGTSLSSSTLLGGVVPEKVLVWFEASEGVLHVVQRKSASEFTDRIFRKKGLQ